MNPEDRILVFKNLNTISHINSIKNQDLKKIMTEDEIGGRPVDITKQGDKIKIVFHPMSKDAKHPKAALFTVILSKDDLAKIKKSL